MKKFLKSNHFKFAFTFLFVGMLVFIFNYLTPLCADDYSYMYAFGHSERERITSVFDIFPSMYAHYFSMNGRLVTHFLAQLFLLFGKSIFNIINTVAFLLFGVLICIHAKGSVKNIKAFSLLITYTLLFLFTPAFGESFLWVTGASNYLYGPIIILCFLLPYRFNYNSLSSYSALRNIFYMFSMFVFGLIAGDTNENTSVAVLCILVIYLIFRIKKYKNIQLWSVFGFIGALIGCVFMLISPGTHKRLGGNELFDIPAILKRFVLDTFYLLENFGFIFILLAIILAVYFIHFKNKSSKSNKNKIENKLSFVKKLYSTLLFNIDLFFVYFVLFLFSFYSLIIPGFPDRVMSGVLMFLIICIIYMYDKCIPIIKNSNKKIFESFISIVLIIVCCGIYCNNIFEMKFVYNAYQDRISTIQYFKKNGDNNVKLPSISSKSKYSCYCGDGDLSSDENSWQNAGIARFYEIDSVIKSGTVTLNEGFVE